MIYDTTTHMYTDFKIQYPEEKISESSFYRIKKEMKCEKSKGLVDCCYICLGMYDENNAEEKFIRDQHLILVKKSSRALNTILNYLPKSLIFLFCLKLYNSFYQ
jgi:hypothetical protein